MHVFGRSHREHANYTDFTPTTFLLQDANHCTTVTPNDFIFKNLFFKKAKKKPQTEQNLTICNEILPASSC